MDSSIKARYLRRYTDLSATIDLLMNRRLTLLSPLTWDDRNDRAVMFEYARSQNFQTVLGVCLSLAKETYHHWRVFTQGSSGVCIEFNRKKFLSEIPSEHFRHGHVKYKSPKEFTTTYSTSWELPFIKGDAYRHEIEYRIIYTDEHEKLPYKHIPIGIDSIGAIKISPWMPKPLVESTIGILKSIPGCDKLVIKHSKIIENEAWIRYVNGGV